jgi:hypothetical protein
MSSEPATTMPAATVPEEPVPAVKAADVPTDSAAAPAPAPEPELVPPSLLSRIKHVLTLSTKLSPGKEAEAPATDSAPADAPADPAAAPVEPAEATVAPAEPATGVVEATAAEPTAAGDSEPKDTPPTKNKLMALLSKIRPPTKKAKPSKSPKRDPEATSDKEKQAPAATEVKDSTTPEVSAPTELAAVAPTEPPAAASTDPPAPTEPVANVVEETTAAPVEPAKPEEKDAEVTTKEKSPISPAKIARRISTRLTDLLKTKPKADTAPSTKVVGEHPPKIEQPEPVAPLTVVEEAAQAPSSSAATAPVAEETAAAPSATVAAPVLVATA